MPPILRWFPGLYGFAMPALRWWIKHTFTLTLCLTVVYSILLVVQPRFLPPELWLGDTEWRLKPDHVHPISRLIEQAGMDWWKITDSGTNYTYVAAWEYRKRRGRDPPPGFDVWAKAALETNSVIIEPFFDRIYKDLAPFWSIEPKHLRFMVYSQPNVIRIRDGRVYHYTNDDDKTNWVETWARFLEGFADELPDVDIPVNVMTTPRLAVDWEKINKSIEAEMATRNASRSPHDAISAYSGLKDKLPIDPLGIEWKYTHNWQKSDLAIDPKAYWLQYRRTCPLASPSRNIGLNMADSINNSFPDAPNSNFMTNGYISNMTTARDPCEQPYIRGMYGLFVQCEGVSSSDDLMPIFSGSKLPGNNDILLPSPIYLAQEPVDFDKDPRNITRYEKKADRLFWRGRATGGVTQWDNWWRFQRHRFVQMTDGVRAREFYNDGKVNAPSFSLPHPLEFAGFYPEAFQHHDV